MGTLINVIAILMGGGVGLLFRKGFPERISQTAFQVMGIFTLVVGITMALQGREMIMVLVSLAFGGMLGEWIDIEGHLDRWAAGLEKRLHLTEASPAKGFIYTTLLFCVGSMAIIGSITDGLKGDRSVLVTKAMMDGILAIPFAAKMGIGVLGSAIPVLFYQGSITLLAWKLQSLFTPVIVRELTSVGGLIVMGIGVNILGLQKVRVGNLIPALFFIVILVSLKAFFIH